MALLDRCNEFSLALTTLSIEWSRAVVPVVVAAVAGGAVALIVSQERIASARASLGELQQRVALNTEIIVRTDEKLARTQQDIVQILRTHEGLQARVDDLSEFSARRCLACHMTKAVNHPDRRKVPLP